MTDEVVVFHKAGCPFAARLRARLTLARIPYRSVRFADDEVGAAAVRAHHEQGWEVSPTVLVDGRYLSNPSLSDVREALAAR